jgi:phosphoadenosine phosphosulfate reductase
MQYLDVKTELNQLSASEGLQWVSEHLSNARFSTSFGLEDQVITHMIASDNLSVDIFTLDTGRLFQETYDVMELTRNTYKLPIQSYYPLTAALEKLISEKGPNSFYQSVENRKECCYLRKIEPLQRALASANIWITGLRAEQNQNRSQMDLVEWDDSFKIIKYNPLLHWSLADVEKYIDEHHVPVNTLHKKGFPSIGCAPCTRAIMPGEDIRAGRWWWETSSKECGLHAKQTERVKKVLK